MNEEKKMQNKEERLTRYMFVAAILALCIAFCAVPAYGWLYYGRRAAAIAKISNPTAIYISAANVEDIAYMDMTGLDLEKGQEEVDNGISTGRSYEDFVFCIHGHHVNSYKLQLAYTTNNQFEYDIFPAALATVENPMPNNVKGHVVYLTHPDSGTAEEQNYYIGASTDALAGTFLNRKGEAILAYTVGDTAAAGSKNYHEDTYDTYDLVDKFAEPLYWQTTNSIITSPDEDKRFVDYFILRVYWTSGSKNNKESDIIYISARNTTV